MEHTPQGEKKETIKHSEPTGSALTLRHINERERERKKKITILNEQFERSQTTKTQ